MKALYTIIDNTLYKVDQIPRNPFIIAKNMENKSTLSFDDGRRQVSLNVWLDSFNTNDVKTNKAMYYEMIEGIKENEITSIPTIQNSFKMTIDYSLFTKTGKEIDHSVSVQTIDPVDAILPIGIAKNNELVYRFVKVFKKKINFRFKDSIPYGIMKKPFDKYILKINQISIFEDTNTEEEIHKSLEERPFRAGSQTVSSSLEFTKLVFSSVDAGVEYYPIELTYIPRLINFNMEIMLSEYIVAFDESDVEKALTEVETITNTTEEIIPSTGDEEKKPSPSYPLQDVILEDEEEDFIIDPGPELSDGFKHHHHHHDHHDHHHYHEHCDCEERPPHHHKPDFDPNDRPVPPSHKPDHDFPPHFQPDDSKPKPPKPSLPYRYVRCEFEDKKALIVISDDYPDDLFNKKTMVRIKDVIKDIPNIIIGEYVKREFEKPYQPPCKPDHKPPFKPDHHHHHHDCDCNHNKYVPIGSGFISDLFEEDNSEE